MERLERNTLLSKNFLPSMRDPALNNQKKVVEDSLRMIKNKVFESDYNSKHIEVPKQSRDIQVTLSELYHISESSLKLQQVKQQRAKQRSSSYQDYNSHYTSVNSAYNADSVIQAQAKQQEGQKQQHQESNFYDIQQNQHSSCSQNSHNSQSGDQLRSGRKNKGNYILNHQEFNFLFNQFNREKNGVIREKILNLESQKPDFMIYQTKQTEPVNPRLLQIQESVPKYTSVEKKYHNKNIKQVIRPREYSPFLNATKNIMMKHRQDNTLKELLHNQSQNEGVQQPYSYSSQNQPTQNYDLPIEQNQKHRLLFTKQYTNDSAKNINLHTKKNYF